MPSKEEKLYKAVENNNIKKVKALLLQKDSFDINWKNPNEVGN